MIDDLRHQRNVWSVSGPHNPCPVCGRVKDGDCRTTDGALVLCHSHRHLRKGDTIQGYDGQTWRCVGITETGAGWGQFVPQTDPWQKPTRPAGETYYAYPDRQGSPLVRVKRIDDGQGRKRFVQERWDGHRWVAGLGDLDRSRVPIYRYADVRAAIESGTGPKLDSLPLVVWVEGEKTADALWSVGIPATTSLGGSGGFTSYGSYYADLAGASLVIAPDRDAKGLQYARQVALAFNGQVKGWIYAGESQAWQHPSDGYDLADWIAELRAKGLDDAAIRRQILGAIEPCREVPGEQPDVTPELVDGILAESQARFDIRGLIHGKLANAIELKARSFNLPPELLLSVFLVTASSLIPHKLELGDEYLIPGILWLGVVGDSGTGKSPVLDTFTRPLAKLQTEAFNKYEQEMEEWRLALENLEKGEKRPSQPNRRFYYLSDFTWESLAPALKARNHLLIYSDELAGFVFGQNQYKQRGGNDRQRWLTAYNGGVIDVQRVGKSYHIPDACLSVLGGIQPSTLRKLIANDREVIDGFWARFMWVEMPHRKQPCPIDMPEVNLSGLLISIYRVLDQRASVSTTFRLCPQGKRIWRQWWDEIQTLIDDELNPFIKTIYPKLLERAGRIALVSHCVNCAVSNAPPGDTIPAETLESAIEFTRWTLQQAKTVYGDCGHAESPEAQRIARFIQRFQGKQVDGRRVNAWWTGSKKPRAQACRDFLNQLVALGYAQVVKGSPDKPDFTVLVTGAQVQNGRNPHHHENSGAPTAGAFLGAQVHSFPAHSERCTYAPESAPNQGAPETPYRNQLQTNAPDAPDSVNEVVNSEPPAGDDDEWEYF
ncbi:MAG: DUF3987 domain-containing protein [Gloeomargarita sp. SKYG116]|nr:DUF3987 domain-containing protein [Gloeomargarita sp. SKYG116]MCS7226747.1 DUF3987 domain-containing protein [Gloeomargarita sp. SKYB31]MDW8401968.1 DUF3987 domain-containing protein [Gloeomargarita sp. SKYGB_i_bin116]